MTEKAKTRRANDRGSELLVEIQMAGRENSTATVLYHNAIAEKAGLNATESKTLDIVLRLGPQTAGQIAAHTGLTTGSATSLIDRLEHKGFVRRVRDPEDRRKVIVEPKMKRIDTYARLYTPLAKPMQDLIASYSDKERATILDFLRRSAELLRQATRNSSIR